MQRTEPATGARHAGRHLPWLFGYSSYDQNPVAVKIQSLKQDYREDYRIGISYREYTFQFGPDPSKRIVGWKVISNWGDYNNGDWWKESNGPILLGDEGSIHVKGEYARGTNWSVIWYYVDAEDYPFD